MTTIGLILLLIIKSFLKTQKKMSSNETFEIIVKKGKSLFRNVKIEDGNIMVNNQSVAKLSEKTPVNIIVDGNIKGDLVVKTDPSKGEIFVSHGDSYTSYGGVARCTGGMITINNGNHGQSSVQTSKRPKQQSAVTVNGDVEKVNVGNGDIFVKGDCKSAEIINGEIRVKGECNSARAINGDVIVEGNSTINF